MQQHTARYFCDLCHTEVKSLEELKGIVVEIGYGTKNLMRHGMGQECCSACASTIEAHLMDLLTVSQVRAWRFD